MPEVPTFDQLLWPALVALKATGGSASNDELLTKVLELGRIPDAIASIAHSDGRQTKVGYNLAWAKSYLKKAGLVDNSQRGVWSLTEAGEKASESDMVAVPSTVRKASYDRRRIEGGGAGIGSDGGDEADAEIAPWKDLLLAALRKLDPSAFERLRNVSFARPGS